MVVVVSIVLSISIVIIVCVYARVIFRAKKDFKKLLTRNWRNSTRLCVRDRPKTDFTFSAENENGPKMTFHFRPETETKTATYFRPKTKTKTNLSSLSNNMRQSNVLLCEKNCEYSYDASWNNPKWDCATFYTIHTNYDEYKTWSLSGLHCTTWLATYLSIREWLQYSYLETGLNWLTSAAVQWHADTPWQQTLCPSLSEPQIVNAFKSDYVAAATAAEARISFELRPTIRWLWSSLFTAENYCVFGRKRKKRKYIFGRKRKWPKPSKIVIFGAENENENEFRSVSIYDELPVD